MIDAMREEVTRKLEETRQKMDELYSKHGVALRSGEEAGCFLDAEFVWEEWRYWQGKNHAYWEVFDLLWKEQESLQSANS